MIDKNSKSSEKTLNISCGILLLCAVGWSALAAVAWLDTDRGMAMRLLYTGVAVGWAATFALTLKQRNKLKKKNREGE